MRDTLIFFNWIPPAVYLDGFLILSSSVSLVLLGLSIALLLHHSFGWGLFFVVDAPSGFKMEACCLPDVVPYQPSLKLKN